MTAPLKLQRFVVFPSSFPHNISPFPSPLFSFLPTCPHTIPFFIFFPQFRDSRFFFFFCYCCLPNQPPILGAFSFFHLFRHVSSIRCFFLQFRFLSYCFLSIGATFGDRHSTHPCHFCQLLCYRGPFPLIGLLTFCSPPPVSYHL